MQKSKCKSQNNFMQFEIFSYRETILMFSPESRQRRDRDELLETARSTPEFRFQLPLLFFQNHFQLLAHAVNRRPDIPFAPLSSQHPPADFKIDFRFEYFAG